MIVPLLFVLLAMALSSSQSACSGCDPVACGWAASLDFNVPAPTSGSYDLTICRNGVCSVASATCSESKGDTLTWSGSLVVLSGDCYVANADGGNAWHFSTAWSYFNQKSAPIADGDVFELRVTDHASGDVVFDWNQPVNYTREDHCGETCAHASINIP